MNTLNSCSSPTSNNGTLVGVSPWAQNLRCEVSRVAQHSSSVLISGPTGTGKEMIARAIHAQSQRADMPFIPVDCGAIVESLFASHLFGHVKGAFTGAHYDAMGCFRLAKGGTVFLDEIGELKPEIQVKLLRALQERTIVPVGGADAVDIDVRIIAATNRDLEVEVDSGEFREDLYYRLNVISLSSDPLESHIEDISILSNLFLKQMSDEEGMPYKRLTVEAVEALQSYHWPGNVRQLKNVIERCVVYADTNLIDDVVVKQQLQRERPRCEKPLPSDKGTPSTLSSPSQWVEAAKDVNRTNELSWMSLADLERYYITQTLKVAGFNKSSAARKLKVTRRVLAGKMKTLGL